MKISNESYVDYAGVLAFRAMGIVDPKFTVKEVKVGEETVPLVHVSGVQASSGVIVNLDLWPRNHATADDLASLKSGIAADITFRIGYRPEVDDNGNVFMKPGSPKWLTANVGGTDISLSGNKRLYAGGE